MTDFLTRASMMPPTPPTKNPPNGQRVQLPHENTGVGPQPWRIVPNVSAGLISARNLEWGAWAITLDPILYGTQSSQGSYVYQSAVGAPSTQWVGYPSYIGQPLVRLQIGVAGIQRIVCFDYPIAGGAFVVNANSIELSVSSRVTTVAGVGYPDEQHVPTVGAWITPSASPAGPTSMILSAGTELVGGLYNVPPFAKNLVVSAYQTDAAPPAPVVPLQEMQVDWYGEGFTGPIFFTRQGVGGASAAGPSWTRFPVPPQAVAVGFSPSVVNGFQVCGLWELTFA